jgi:quercetin dioxygenase-like cupin family protein
MDADRWQWPEELDALVAAPGNHQLMLENDRVRVLLTTIPIGATTPVHTHRWPSVEYIVAATGFVRRDAGGNVLFDARAANAAPAAGDVLWSEPFPPHSLDNVGDSELRVIMVEIKRRSDGGHDGT